MAESIPVTVLNFLQGKGFLVFPLSQDPFDILRFHLHADVFLLPVKILFSVPHLLHSLDPMGGLDRGEGEKRFSRGRWNPSEGYGETIAAMISSAKPSQQSSCLFSTHMNSISPSNIDKNNVKKAVGRRFDSLTYQKMFFILLKFSKQSLRDSLFFSTLLYDDHLSPLVLESHFLHVEHPNEYEERVRGSDRV